METGNLPEPRRNFRINNSDGRFLAKVDACWPQAHLVVELDGLRWHRTARQRREDQARQNRLTIAGW